MARIDEYPDYEVTDNGEILNRDGNFVPFHKTKIGYLAVHIVNANGEKKIEYVHRLVMMANGGIPDGLEVNHKNALKMDNRLSNLELVTHAENIKHAVALGLFDRSKDGKQKLNELYGSVR